MASVGSVQPSAVELPLASSHAGGVPRLRSLRQFVRRKPLAAFGGGVILLLFVVALFAPVLATHNPATTQPFAKWAPLSAQHYLGGDYLGRDIYSRLVYGARESLVIGFGASSFGVLLATVIGVVSGYFGGWFDMLFQRLIDIAISFPFLILLITVLQILPKTSGTLHLGVFNLDASGQKALYITLTLGIVLSFSASRVVRASVIAVKSNQYVEGARSIGAGTPRLLVRYIVPNVIAPIIVLFSVYIGSTILIEASLAFLGFGLPPTIPSWGQMLNDARPGLSRAVNPSIWPGLAIALTVWSFNMFGDGLRDVLDPRLRGSR